MFAGKAESFVKGPAVTADNFAQAFYKRKTGAAFSKEMARSVKAMLEAYTGRGKSGTAGRKAVKALPVCAHRPDRRREDTQGDERMEQNGLSAENFSEMLRESDCLLIGIGAEWETGAGRPSSLQPEQAKRAYEALGDMVKGKDYFIITTVTDGKVRESSLDQSRIVAPCGNEQWKQCSRACTRT